MDDVATPTTPTTTYTYVPKPPCHRGVHEVTAGLWVGRLWDIEESAPIIPLDIIVPLANLDGAIWRKWRGEIMAVPIQDGLVLPPEILERTVSRIVAYLDKGLAIAIGCQGGHGRTGYLASAVLGRLFPDLDPIAQLRDVYCSEVVETRAQVDALTQFLGIDLSHHQPAHMAAIWTTSYQDGILTKEVPSQLNTQLNTQLNSLAEWEGMGVTVSQKAPPEEELDDWYYDSSIRAYIQIRE